MSWAWRSFLGRGHSLLLSPLLPVHRHDSQNLRAALGSNSLIASRRYASMSSGGPDVKVKRHLYVVLDDQEDGYGVHKLDLGDHHYHLEGGARRLPEPPVLYMTLTTLWERVQFAAVGSSIVAIGNTLRSPLLDGRYVPGHVGGVLIYNTKTSALSITPHLPTSLCDGGYKAAMAVWNTLYLLGSEPPFDCSFDCSDDCGGSLHCLTADLDPDHTDEYYWEPLSGTSPWYWSSFNNPVELPFMGEYIMDHATHISPRRPPTRPKIWVSLRPTKASPSGATFSFSTKSGRWRRQGKRHMPVIGQVHYDDEMNAWVGLHAVSEGNIYSPLMTDGRLCVGNYTSPRSEWKVGTEKLFRLDEDGEAGWRHVDAKLVPIALDEGRNEYCLMERLRPEVEEAEEKEEEGFWGVGGRCLLRLTTFRVERSKDGEPMATARRPARSYEVSWHNRHFDAQAFWM